MNDRALEKLSEDLARSLERLAEALRVPEEEPLAIDGTIQRFEFTFELFWKMLQRRLARNGVEANSPRVVLQQSYRLRWLDDEPSWLKALEDRNLALHAYRATLVASLHRRVPQHYAVMRAAFEKLRPQRGG
jgi:nucleotidyltransferase substrate binding protein (TIGR01987 family)